MSLPTTMVLVEVTYVARDSRPLLDKLFQQTCDEIFSSLALLLESAVDVSYTNIILPKFSFKMIYDNRSERIHRSAYHRLDDMSRENPIREDSFTSTGL